MVAKGHHNNGGGRTGNYKIPYAIIQDIQKLRYEDHLSLREIGAIYGYSWIQLRSCVTALPKGIVREMPTADGVPECQSLVTLGARRGFTVSDCSINDGEPAHDYTRISYNPGGGIIVNKRTSNMLALAVTALADSYSWTPYLVQGSYHPGVSGSAGTHDGGGVVDIRVTTMTENGRNLCVQALREVGFAAWYRTPAEGFDVHIHAVAIGDREMSPSALSQVGQYFDGTNGLANHGPDTLPSSYPVVKPSWVNKYNV